MSPRDTLPDDEDLIFADTEGDDLVLNLKTMWTIQLAKGPTGEVIVYADQPGYPPISEALEILRNAKAIVGHNFLNYDANAINKLYPGTLDWSKVIDTLVISRLRDATASRHSLGDLGEALGYPKGDFHDFSKFSEEMVTYGRQDVRILQKAWVGARKVPPFRDFYRAFHRACNLEFATAHIISQQELHGFRFDYDKAVELEAELRVEHKEAERGLQAIFPPIVKERYSEKTGKRLKDSVEVFNPGSRDQIADRLITKYGWKPTKFTPTKKPKVDEEVLKALKYPEAQAMASYMTLGKKLGQLSDGDNSWLKLAVQYKDEWRIHGQVNTLGARTHRMAHFKPNVAQVDKDARMRGLFKANHGQVLVGVDAEGLELRMLAHYLFPYDGGSYANTVHAGDKSIGTDIHTVNQKAAGLYLRDSAKTLILKLGSRRE